MPSAAVNVLSKSPRHALASVNERVLIGAFVKTPQLDDVREYLTAGLELKRTRPGAFAVMTVAYRPGSPPDSPTRGLFGQMMRELDGPAVGTAVVATGGSGLATSVVRGVLAGLLIVVDHKTPIKMFGDVAEASRWLCDVGEKKQVHLANARELADAVGTLTAAFDQT